MTEVWGVLYTAFAQEQEVIDAVDEELNKRSIIELFSPRIHRQTTYPITPFKGAPRCMRP